VTFRDRTAFVLLYDMSSKIQVDNLEQWITKILTESTLTSSILFIIGDSAYADLMMQCDVQDTLEKIFKSHGQHCTCKKGAICRRLFFAGVNLQTGKGINQVLGYLAKELVNNTQHFLKELKTPLESELEVGKAEASEYRQFTTST